MWFACERVSARYNKIKKKKKMKIPLGGHWTSFRIVQQPLTNKKISVWPHNPRYVPYLSDFLNGTHYVHDEEGDRAWWGRNWELGRNTFAQCDATFFSTLKEERESSDAHKINWRHVVMIAICLQKK